MSAGKARRLLDLRWLGTWLNRHRRWCGLWLGAGSLSLMSDVGSGPGLLVVGLAPGLCAFAWRAVSPAGYERIWAAPSRRMAWRRQVCRHWHSIAEHCGIAGNARGSYGHDINARARILAPQLRKVRARGHTLELTIRAHAGQTVEDLELAAPRLASTLAAVSFRTRPVSGGASGCTSIIELVMADELSTPITARVPDPLMVVDQVRLGRTQGGADWSLQLRGRHTLVAGCSGAGKGSVLWGICCGLAPAVRADLVRLWGIDLKRGVELEMGTALFSAHAYSAQEALAVLQALIRVIEDRGTRMAGLTRLHTPVAGDPLHVLVIDELAALTAYADLSIRREAERLLSEILTQGRALGIVVVACVQDPRKDVVAMRGLFTQTVALRLRSSEETAMVLGDGMSRIAPAHRISPAHPGIAWVVDDAGAADRVRADFWPDYLIRDLSSRLATPVAIDVSLPVVGSSPNVVRGESGDLPSSPSSPRSRQPRPSAGKARLIEGGAT